MPVWNPGAGGGGASVPATISTPGTVTVDSPPRSGLNPTVPVRRLAADKWVRGRAITTQFSTDATKAATGVAATGVFTVTSHAYTVGNLVTFVLTTGGSGLTAGLPYYVNTVPSTNTFTVALAPGGATVTFTTDLTAGTAQRQRDGNLFTFSNLVFTTSASRPALRAADGGTAVQPLFLTKATDFKDWEIRLRYRPANDATTTSTDYGIGLLGAWWDVNNGIQMVEAHAAGNPTGSPTFKLAGLNASNSMPVLTLDVSPRSTTQDRVVKFRKEGDRLLFKDWASNTVEPDWQLTARMNVGSATDLPESGALGFGGNNFCGAYFLEFAAHELRRQSENVLWNTDLAKIETLAQFVGATAGDGTTRVTGGVGATGVFTTATAHSYAVGDRVVFYGFSGGAGAGQPLDVGIWAGTSYYVAATPLATTFTVATTRGGVAITFANNMGVGYVIRNPPPAWWDRARQGLLLANNYLEVVHIAGPDGSIRPALSMVFATANDPNMIWTQDLYDVSRTTGEAGGYGGILTKYPQFEAARRMEASFWTKGSLANLPGTTLGVTMDNYMYDHNGAVLLMDRNTYHPGVSPNTLVDTAPDPASYDGNQSNSTWGWTYMTSVLETKMWESIMRNRVQFLLHDAAVTGNVLIMDPSLRPID